MSYYLTSGSELITNGVFGQEGYRTTYHLGEELALVDLGTSHSAFRIINWLQENGFPEEELAMDVRGVLAYLSWKDT